MFDGDIDGIEVEDINKGRELSSSSDEFVVFLAVNVTASAIVIAISIKQTNEIIIL